MLNLASVGVQRSAHGWCRDAAHGARGVNPAPAREGCLLRAQRCCEGRRAGVMYGAACFRRPPPDSDRAPHSHSPITTGQRCGGMLEQQGGGSAGEEIPGI